MRGLGAGGGSVRSDTGKMPGCGTDGTGKISRLRGVQRLQGRGVDIPASTPFGTAGECLVCRDDTFCIIVHFLHGGRGSVSWS